MNAMAIFAIQVVVSAALISFSITMLATGRGETSVYLPLLSGVTATWLPNPSYPKGNMQPNEEHTASANVPLSPTATIDSQHRLANANANANAFANANAGDVEMGVVHL